MFVFCPLFAEAVVNVTKDNGILDVVFGVVVVAASVGLVVEVAVIVVVVCVLDELRGFKSGYILKHDLYFNIHI